MPNYLCLTDKEGQRFEGRKLIEVDDKMREALGEPADPTRFYMGWVDWEMLYSTNDWAEVRKRYIEWGMDQKLPVIDWLAENYSLDGYYCPR
jgi:hypothetical protein